MKIALFCESPLLNETLQIYLKSLIAPYSQCDFVVSDKLEGWFSKPICLIDFSPNSKVQRPFSKDSLIRDLNIFYIENELKAKNISKTHSKLDSIESKNEVINTATENKIKLDSKEEYKIQTRFKLDSNTSLEKEIEIILKEFAFKISEVVRKHNNAER